MLVADGYERAASKTFTQAALHRCRETGLPSGLTRRLRPKARQPAGDCSCSDRRDLTLVLQILVTLLLCHCCAQKYAASSSSPGPPCCWKSSCELVRTGCSCSCCSLGFKGYAGLVAHAVQAAPVAGLCAAPQGGKLLWQGPVVLRGHPQTQQVPPLFPVLQQAPVRSAAELEQDAATTLGIWRARAACAAELLKCCSNAILMTTGSAGPFSAVQVM